MQPSLLTLLGIVTLYTLYRNFGLRMQIQTSISPMEIQAEARRKSDAIVASANERLAKRTSHLRLVK